MGILGTIILIFIIIHMGNFWARNHWGGLPFTKYQSSLEYPERISTTRLPISGRPLAYVDYVDINNKVRVVIVKDLYRLVQYSFKQWWYVLLYVISMAALGFHLVHGFKSAFETLGWDYKKYFPLIRFLSVWIWGIIIPATFAAIPYISFSLNL